MELKLWWRMEQNVPHNTKRVGAHLAPASTIFFADHIFRMTPAVVEIRYKLKKRAEI